MCVCMRVCVCLRVCVCVCVCVALVPSQTAVLVIYVQRYCSLPGIWVCVCVCVCVRECVSVHKCVSEWSEWVSESLCCITCAWTELHRRWLLQGQFAWKVCMFVLCVVLFNGLYCMWFLWFPCIFLNLHCDNNNNSSNEYFFDGVSAMVRKLQPVLTSARGSGAEVLYTVIESLTQDGRFLSRAHTRNETLTSTW